MRIACVQTRARNAEEEALALEEALKGVDRGAAQGADLVLLPEAVWPGYVLGPWLEGRNPEEVVEQSRKVWELFSRKAREKKIGLGAGMLTVRSGKYYNSLVLFDPRGEELGRGDKRFLWHFDRNWFTPGETLKPLDTPWGKVGLLVCADARIPEIARSLVRQGAWLLLDAANLTSTGGSLEKATNQQVEFMLSTRARENGVYLAMANKSGLERDAVLYCGRSSLWNPRGELMSRAESPGEGLALEDADPSEALALRKHVEFPEKLWSFLGSREKKSPSLFSDKPAKSLLMTGVLQAEWKSSESFRWLERALWDLSVQGASLALLPPFPEDPEFGESLRERLRRYSKKYENLVLAACLEEKERKKSLVLSGGNELASLSEVPETELFEMPWGRFGVLWGDRGEIPEISRALVLQGADILLWGGGSGEREPLYAFARTRAAENRVFVALAGSDGGAAFFGPGGEILAQGLAEGRQAILGGALLPLAKIKEFIPGTDVIRDRNPGQYVPEL